jgi:hypothetical protein
MKQIADMTIDDIIARKREARAERARLSFGQKVMIVESMRERLAPFNKMRERRKLKTQAS